MMNYTAKSSLLDDPDPTRKEASDLSDHKKFQYAMETEIRAIEQNAVWSFDHFTLGNEVDSTRCVYHVKRRRTDSSNGKRIGSWQRGFRRSRVLILAK